MKCRRQLLLHPSSVIHHPYSHSGFTLLEMLTTVAALVIVLGLMVSLARDVRSRSADRLTKDLLGRLDRMMGQYWATNDRTLPSVLRLIESNPLNEAVLHPRASKNNGQFVNALLHQEQLAKEDLEVLPLTVAARRAPRLTAQDAREQEFDAAIYDAWGGPVVFMPSQHPAIGMAPSDRFFFFSAGPDGRFLTREDNLYSYDATIDTAAGEAGVTAPYLLWSPGQDGFYGPISITNGSAGANFNTNRREAQKCDDVTNFK
jgi:prepilin-type N-terminal cleavage/methylation domain-containing protein